MLNLFSFFDDADTTTGSDWVIWVVLGVFLVGMILLTIIPQRKQRKKAEEMMAKLDVGSDIITIGGVVGTVVQLDERYVWIETGTEDNKYTVKFLRQAIHSLVPEPGTPEAEALQPESKKDDTDEIK